MNLDTESTVRTLVADGKGILAADETPGTGTPLPHVLASRASGPSTTPIGVLSRSAGPSRCRCAESRVAFTPSSVTLRLSDPPVRHG